MGSENCFCVEHINISSSAKEKEKEYERRKTRRRRDFFFPMSRIWVSLMERNAADLDDPPLSRPLSLSLSPLSWAAAAVLFLSFCLCIVLLFLPNRSSHVRIAFFYPLEKVFLFFVFFFFFLVRFPAVFELLSSPSAPPPPLFFFHVYKSLSFYSSSWCIPAPCENIPNAQQMSFVCSLLLFNKYNINFVPYFQPSTSLSLFHVTHLLIRVPKMSNASLSLLVLCVLVYYILYIRLLLVERYSYYSFGGFGHFIWVAIAGWLPMSPCRPANRTKLAVVSLGVCRVRPVFGLGFFFFFFCKQENKTSQISRMPSCALYAAKSRWQFTNHLVSQHVGSSCCSCPAASHYFPPLHTIRRSDSFFVLTYFF